MADHCHTSRTSNSIAVLIATSLNVRHYLEATSFPSVELEKVIQLIHSIDWRCWFLISDH